MNKSYGTVVFYKQIDDKLIELPKKTRRRPKNCHSTEDVVSLLATYDVFKIPKDADCFILLKDDKGFHNQSLATVDRKTITFNPYGPKFNNDIIRTNKLVHGSIIKHISTKGIYILKIINDGNVRIACYFNNNVKCPCIGINCNVDLIGYSKE